MSATLETRFAFRFQGNRHERSRRAASEALFQVISQRYERGSTIVTSNRSFKHWPEIFNNDSMLTSALLDRLLHHAETAVIEGRSYRMCEQTET